VATLAQPDTSVLLASAFSAAVDVAATLRIQTLGSWIGCHPVFYLTLATSSHFTTGKHVKAIALVHVTGISFQVSYFSQTRATPYKGIELVSF